MFDDPRPARWNLQEGVWLLGYWTHDWCDEVIRVASYDKERQVVRNNRIHDAPHNAVLYGGNEHLFELNEIYRVVMETGDAGAFYTGRDWTSQGNVLRHNYIHDLGGGDDKQVNTMGVYLDDCDSGDTLEGNVFFRAGRAIMIGGGRDNPVLNNLVVECPIGLHIDARGMTWQQWNNPSDTSWCLEEKAKRFNYTQPP